MYELVILGFLMRGPHHGYLIAKIINDMIGPFARLSNGRLYPLLGKLEKEGFITVVAPSAAAAPTDHQHRTFEITEAGRNRFFELMLDTSSNPGDYQRIFWIKLSNFPWLEPGDRLYLLDHYVSFCQTHLYHLDTECRDLQRKAEEAPVALLMRAEHLQATLEAMHHLQDQWQLELDSARRWRARELEMSPYVSASEPTGIGNEEGADRLHQKRIHQKIHPL